MALRKRRDVPFRTGRLPFVLHRWPLWSAYFACSESMETALASAFRAEAVARLSGEDVMASNLPASTETVTTACEGGLANEDSCCPVVDFVD